MFAVSLPSDTNGSKKKSPSIIDMANAAYSMGPSSAVSSSDSHRKGSDASWNSSRSRNNSISSVSSSSNLDERLDAARAMLGISPCSVADGSVGSIMAGRSRGQGRKEGRPSVTLSTPGETRNGGRRPRSNSAGLDALAFLATREQEAATGRTTPAATIAIGAPASATTPAASGSMAAAVQSTLSYSSVSLVANPAVTSSDDDDSETMPPPPPRTTVTRRRRSVSNPEGMDKWGLPATSAAIDANSSNNGNDNDNSNGNNSYNNPQYQTMRRLRLVLPASILEEEIAEANAAVIAKEKSTASASALAASLLGDHNPRLHRSSHLPLVEEEDEADENEEEALNHQELLRRARSRLLEDLSQSNLTGEKGVLTLPHSLVKYKEVYNKNGRIGIYTPAERAAIIARFQSKRTRRVWNKKIRYNCRKNLADRRLRVKGRFVKRSQTPATATATTTEATAATKETTPKTPSFATEGVGALSKPASTVPEDTEADNNGDTDMPDVTDPDAGFCPTNEQPYRRLRRHTIT